MSKVNSVLYKYALNLISILVVVSCSTDAKNSDTPDAEADQEQPKQEETQEQDPAEEIGLKEINPSVFIGANIGPDFENVKYMGIHQKEFNSNQALFYAGFGGWPAQGELDLENFNAVVNWMYDKQVSPHVHMLVGPNFYMPDWLKNGNWTNEELDNHLKNLVYGIMDANDNAEKIDAWNIANEVFKQDGGYIPQEDMLWIQLGFEEDESGLTGEDKINDRHPIFLRKAFGYGRDKTDKILEYRDYLIESGSPDSGWHRKQKAVFQLLKHMQNSGIPIDAVGIQGHHDIGNIDWVTQENGIKTAVEKFKTLNLEVYITEMDVGTKDQEWTEALAEQQKLDYYTYIKQALEGGADRIYTWGIQDGRDKGWRVDEHPLPWDRNLEKKPAYEGIKQALEDTKG